jgi:predicted nucleic acid-binding protein
MNVLLDTNIIISLVRAKSVDAIINFINPHNSLLYISVVSEAELKSLWR